MWLDLRLRGHKYKGNIKKFLITRVLCLSRALQTLFQAVHKQHLRLGWFLLKLRVNSAIINLGKDKLSNDTLLLKMQNLKNYCECELSVYHFLKAQKQRITISAGCRCLFFFINAYESNYVFRIKEPWCLMLFSLLTPRGLQLCVSTMMLW